MVSSFTFSGNGCFQTYYHEYGFRGQNKSGNCDVVCHAIFGIFFLSHESSVHLGTHGALGDG